MASVSMSFEESLATGPSFVMGGSAVATLAELPTTGPWPENTRNEKLVQCEQPLNIGFKWTISGPLVPVLAPGCKWKMQVHLERWGAGEYNLPTVINPKIINYAPPTSASGTTYTYNAVINIPANTVPEGIYDVVAVLRLYGPAGQPLPVAGFAEFGKIEFFESI